MSSRIERVEAKVEVSIQLSEIKANWLSQDENETIDKEPIYISFRHSESLPWTMGGNLIPQGGIFTELIRGPFGRRRIPIGITLDCSQSSPPVNIPARFPISALEKDEKGNLYIDCTKAMESGIHPSMNFFV